MVTWDLAGRQEVAFAPIHRCREAEIRVTLAVTDPGCVSLAGPTLRDTPVVDEIRLRWTDSASPLAR